VDGPGGPVSTTLSHAKFFLDLAALPLEGRSRSAVLYRVVGH
jgi:hypothetical protein